MKRIVLIVLVTGLLLIPGVVSATQDPALDSVVGTGSAGTGTFTIEAYSGFLR
jgi:hypothetical protein